MMISFYILSHVEIRQAKQKQYCKQQVNVKNLPNINRVLMLIAQTSVSFNQLHKTDFPS